MATITRVRTVYRGWGKFLLATLRLATGEESDRQIEDHGEAVAVLPYDPVRRTALLVRQLRPPVLHLGEDAYLLEVPAGRADHGTAEESVRAEAREEVGVELGTLEQVASVWTMPGISTEKAYLYLAPYTAADRTGLGGGLPEENEHLAVVELPLADLATMADSGGLVELKLFALILALRQRRPELFA